MKNNEIDEWQDVSKCIASNSSLRVFYLLSTISFELFIHIIVDNKWKRVFILQGDQKEVRNRHSLPLQSDKNYMTLKTVYKTSLIDLKYRSKMNWIWRLPGDLLQGSNVGHPLQQSRF